MQELREEINELYVELYKLYTNTNPYLGCYLQDDGIVKVYHPERIEKCKQEIEALEKILQEKIRVYRNLIIERRK